jgi:hypothetical protein
MFCGQAIEDMMVGGPAYNSQLLSKGDVIVKVDGTPATQDTIHDLLVGSDAPGSSVVLTVSKGGQPVRVCSAVRPVRRNLCRRARRAGQPTLSPRLEQQAAAALQRCDGHSPALPAKALATGQRRWSGGAGV